MSETRVLPAPIPSKWRGLRGLEGPHAQRGAELYEVEHGEGAPAPGHAVGAQGGPQAREGPPGEQSTARCNTRVFFPRSESLQAESELAGVVLG